MWHRKCHLIFYYLRPIAKGVFPSMLFCLSVRFICLSLNKTKEERMNGFSWCFKVGHGTSYNREHFGDGSNNQLCLYFIFIPVGGDGYSSLSAAFRKSVDEWSWNFQDSSDMTQGIIGNIVGQVCFTLSRLIHTPQTRRVILSRSSLSLCSLPIHGVGYNRNMGTSIKGTIITLKLYFHIFVNTLWLAFGEHLFLPLN